MRLFDCIASTHFYPFSPAIIQYHNRALFQLKQKTIQTIERRQNSKTKYKRQAKSNQIVVVERFQRATQTLEFTSYFAVGRI